MNTLRFNQLSPEAKARAVWEYAKGHDLAFADQKNHDPIDFNTAWEACELDTALECEYDENGYLIFFDGEPVEQPKKSLTPNIDRDIPLESIKL